MIRSIPTELEIVWVIRRHEALKCDYLRERICGGFSAKPKMDREIIVAYTKVKRTKGGVLRRFWTADLGPYPEGLYCPSEGVDPASIALNRMSAPALPVLLRKALAAGKDIEPHRQEWLDSYDRGEIDGG